MTRSQEPRPDSIVSQDEGFARRWSRRANEARAARDSTRSDLPVADAPDVAAADAADAATPSAAVPVEDGQDGRGAVAVVAAASEPPGDNDMPPLDTLGPESEVSAFFSPRVSEALRRAALHRIFHQPSFNVTDGLDDYCADYRHLKPLGNVMTSDMRLQMERAGERLLNMTDQSLDLGSDTPAASLPKLEASAEHPVRLPEVEASAEDEEVPDDNH